MKHDIFERGATSFHFSKILASFERSPLSFFHSFVLIINVIFVFFSILKQKKNLDRRRGLLDILSQLLAIYVTRLARFLTNYKRGFTICRTSWLSLRYITVVNASGTAQRCVM